MILLYVVVGVFLFPNNKKKKPQNVWVSLWGREHSDGVFFFPELWLFWTIWSKCLHSHIIPISYTSLKPAITLKVRIQRRTNGGNGLHEPRPGGMQTRAGRLSCRWSWSDITLVVGPGVSGLLGKGLRGASSPYPTVYLPWVIAQPPHCGTETPPLTISFWVSSQWLSAIQKLRGEPGIHGFIKFWDISFLFSSSHVALLFIVSSLLCF